MKIISIRILAASLFFSAFFLSHAQEQRTSEPVVQKNPNCEYAPGVNPAGLDYMATPPALWDIQFVYDTQDSSNYGGQAGVVFTGTEFWVSR